MLNCLEEDKRTFCGTPAYISPEVWIGMQQDEKVDIWAFGIILYELVYNESPIKPADKKEPKINFWKQIEEIKYNNSVSSELNALI